MVYSSADRFSLTKIISKEKNKESPNERNPND
jgi:hypothetical protein